MLRALLSRLLGSAATVPSPASAESDRSRLLTFETDASYVRNVVNERLRLAAPKPVEGGGLDAAALSGKISFLNEAPISDALFSWFAAQSFIGYSMCAFIAQNWLVDKACAMPARDAIRQGYRVTLDNVPSDEAKVRALDVLKRADKRHRINHHLQEWVRFGRIFGIRVAIFEVESTDPLYYERPFNLDAVKPGQFKGISQVDPYWMTPLLDGPAVTDPAAQHFYEPTWWQINGRKYHRTHLAIFRTAEPADILKPTYLYGGVPVTQRIMERVYAAERTANEAPQLAMTKRLTVWNTDVAEILGNEQAFSQHLLNMQQLRDNFGLKINDTSDQMQQFDTSLAHLDETIMTQYSIVAAAANVPETKLMGKAPKGLNATGEYDEASYHEELETIQTNDLTPFLDRYHALVLRSEIEPALGLGAGVVSASVEWNPLDSMTSKEEADVNKVKAETDQILVTLGSIDAQDVRNRLRAERGSGYTGLPEAAPLPDDPLEAAIADLQRGDTPPSEGVNPALVTETTGLTLEDATAALTGDGFTLPRAAGVILFRANGDALWLKRADTAEDAPGTWAWPGGMIDPGEKPQDAAIRELYEETGIDYGAPIVPVAVNDGFVTFSAVSVAALDVRLNDEHTDYVWAPLEKPPSPLHPNVKAFLRG